MNEREEFDRLMATEACDTRLHQHVRCGHRDQRVAMAQSMRPATCRTTHRPHPMPQAERHAFSSLRPIASNVTGWREDLNVVIDPSKSTSQA
jgi:hypothetical protein